MCGRFALFAAPADIARVLAIDSAPAVEPSYNIPPGTHPLVAHADDGDDGGIACERLFWGYRPAWANADAPQPINARAEKVATSPFFRHAFARYRCLVPASGWYEWRQGDDGKVPYYITTDMEVLMFAGIYDPPREEGTGSFAIITQPATPAIAHLHPRMPLVLDPMCYRDWLDRTHQDRDAVKRVTRPLEAGRLRCWPVSRQVNRPVNDDASLIEAIE